MWEYYQLQVLQQQCLHCMQHVGNLSLGSLQLTMKLKRKARWMVIATGKNSGCSCEYTGSILINTPIYPVSDMRHSTLYVCWSWIPTISHHSLSPQKEQHAGHLSLSRAGLFRHTWVRTHVGHLKTHMKAPDWPPGTEQTHNNSTSRPSFYLAGANKIKSLHQQVNSRSGWQPIPFQIGCLLKNCPYQRPDLTRHECIQHQVKLTPTLLTSLA